MNIVLNLWLPKNVLHERKHGATLFQVMSKHADPARLGLLKGSTGQMTVWKRTNVSRCCKSLRWKGQGKPLRIDRIHTSPLALSACAVLEDYSFGPDSVRSVVALLRPP